MKAKTIQQFLKDANQVLATVTPTDKVYYALTLMAKRNLSALLVLQEGKLVGIFSERDYARKVILHGKSSKDTLVEDIMTPNLITVTPEHSVDDCMEIMTEKRIRHLPVVNKHHDVVGIISIGDVVKEVMAEQRFMINELQRYIAG